MVQHSLDRILRRVNSVPFHPTNNPGSGYQGSGWPPKPTPAISGPWACLQRIPPPWIRYTNLFNHLFKRMCGLDIPLCKLQVKQFCYIYSQDRQWCPRFFAWIIIDGPYCTLYTIHEPVQPPLQKNVRVRHPSLQIAGKYIADVTFEIIFGIHCMLDSVNK